MTFMRACFGIRRYRYHPQRVLRKRRVPAAGVPCDRTAKAKIDPFAITVDPDTIRGIVGVDLERGAAERESLLRDRNH
jgi:hypothetical protein